jgi:hypothetical protein
VDNFDSELLKVIDETIAFCLGEINMHILYQYMERKGVPKQEIPNRLEVFAESLENLVGTGRGQILGAAQILENAILKGLSKRVAIKYDEAVPGYFPEKCRRIKEMYLRTKIYQELQPSTHQTA